ncbi:Transmembrane protein [Kalmanozyma brasiliensis GHG001]|uniref:Transmembrane protein n=1 Tax=Kalmanozyma brasiliensis (strain GHG001) TaxID=1365824 RepID=V5EVR7_KALBG|nr:Transmembrane protein [Kalmanozyma brasiliensis GHG001]EST06359.1 Transmembrane protein [Kalmanozyma brasiliensis GHG001]
MPAMNPSAGDSDLTEKAASTLDGGETSLRRNAPALRLPKMTKVNRDQDDSGEDSDDEYARFRANSGPTTPNISETAAQLRRNLSISGLQDLAHTPRSEIRKSAVSKVWRPQDEVARMPSDWERLVVHVIRGGLRAGNLAFALRATLMFVLELVKSLRTRKFNKNSFGIALFGPRNFRFAALFAIWASLYKAVHNSLRLLTPPPVKKPRSRSSSAMFTIEKGDGNTSPDENRSGTSTPRSGRAALEGKSDEEKAKVKAKQKQRAFMPDPRSKIWHAYVAGAISALAVLVETADNRISLAQQLFVRGLEGQYNVAHERGLINIPYGAVITFGLACGQIMWAWLEAPESLDKGYRRWITNASQVAPRVTDVYREIRHEGKADADFVLQKWFPGGKVPEPISTSPLRYPDVAPNAFNRRGIKGKNVRKIVEWMDSTRKGNPGDIIDCSLVHPWETSHWRSPIDRFMEVTRWILPVYLTLHFVPAIFLRPGKFLKDPLGATIRSLRGSFRSSSFLGVFVIIFQTQFCAQHSLYQFIQRRESLNKNVPTWFKQMLISSWLKWFAGFTTCLSLFVDDSRRRAELAAYVLPKGMESAWSVLRQKSYVPFVPGGDLLLTSAGMSLVMGTYAQNPEHLSGLVRRIVYQFVGRN